MECGFTLKRVRDMTRTYSHSRCAYGTCENDMPYLELHKSHSNVDGDMIMDIIPKDGTVRAA